ncbi:MAG: MATE family efflux transporter [Spirochaetales bacterium]|nr:MATE family efflux transporter [Spirochaetales bacterium]
MPLRRNIDMTKGPIVANVLLFALPLMLGNILQQLYTTVDVLVIGNYCDSVSLAALGTSAQPVEIMVNFFMGIGTGVSILTAQAVGSGNQSRLKLSVGTAETFTFVCGIGVSLLGYLLTPAILVFMGVPEDAFAAARIYTRIVFLGSLGSIGYNMNAGILRGLGDSRASLIFLMISCSANIIMDLFFVAVLGLDARGVAIATSLALYLSWFISIAYIRRKFPELEYSYLPRRFDAGEMKRILHIGIPLGINSSLFSFGHLAMQSFINAQGSAFMAAQAVASRITSLSNVAFNAISQSASTFSGQNYGAGNRERLREGCVKIPFSSGLFTIALGLLIYSVHAPILRLFTRDDIVLFYAERFIVVHFSAQWCFSVFSCINNLINGTGKIRYTLMINLAMLWCVRIPAAWLISTFFDGTFVMLAISISFVFGMVCNIGYLLFSRRWKQVVGRI